MFMAEDDKTYCGERSRDPFLGELDARMEILMCKYAVSKQDVLDVMQIVGDDYYAIAAHLHEKQDSY